VNQNTDITFEASITIQNTHLTIVAVTKIQTFQAKHPGTTLICADYYSPHQVQAKAVRFRGGEILVDSVPNPHKRNDWCCHSHDRCFLKTLNYNVIKIAKTVRIFMEIEHIKNQRGQILA